jgi:MFS family permease
MQELTTLSAKETSNLFRASCVALTATAMCFAVRADIMDALAGRFGLSRAQTGWIAGAAFWGFTVAMFAGGQICDLLGMRRLIAFGFFGHVLGILLTACARGFLVLYAGTLLIGMANGIIEAALNPLAATLYPERKTERLNALHVWFPGGIVLGGLMSLVLTHLGCGWRGKSAFLLVPVFIYGMLFRRLHLPPTERVQSSIPTGDMYLEALRPGFLILLFCIVLTAATELGPNQWIPSMLSRTTRLPGILVLVWITGLMAVGRQFAGRLVSWVAPTMLLLFSAVFSAAGLAALGTVGRGWQVFAAATVYALGVCYFWPTLYGITSERHPAGGAFLLGLIGSVGMLSDAFVVPLIGRWYDLWGPAAALRTVAFFPCAVAMVFAAVWWTDRRHGGYKIVKLASPTMERMD